MEKKKKSTRRLQKGQLFASTRAKTRRQNMAWFNLSSRSNGSVFSNLMFTVTLKNVTTANNKNQL